MRTPNTVLRAAAVITLFTAAGIGVAGQASAATKSPSTDPVASAIGAAPGCVAQIKHQLPASMQTTADLTAAAKAVCVIHTSVGRSALRVPGQAPNFQADHSAWVQETDADGGSYWGERISWRYHEIVGLHNHITTVGETPDGPADCTAGWANEGTITLGTGPEECSWQGRIPAFTSFEAFGTTQDFVVDAVVRGIPIHAGHTLSGSTRGDGLVCVSADGGAVICG